MFAKITNSCKKTTQCATDQVEARLLLYVLQTRKQFIITLGLSGSGPCRDSVFPDSIMGDNMIISSRRVSLLLARMTIDS
jgi:hypothetical protein